jgi:hypothetical protein
MLIQGGDPENISRILSIPAQKAINPIFSFFFSKDELLKWHAVSAMGIVVDNMAKQNIEQARIVMRRLMWNLNDESGGIGWGSPEAMGEIMARNKALANEYSKFLTSYINKEGNFIEHDILQRGVLWAIGRLSHSRPELIKSEAIHLNDFMLSADIVKRGLSTWAAEPLKSDVNKTFLIPLLNDPSTLDIYIDGEMVSFSVSHLAGKALENLL